jgi:hypothetical protein
MNHSFTRAMDKAIEHRLSPSAPPPPASAPSAAGGRVRLAYVDNVRWAMILLVLSMHAADTYSPFGNWYYVERPRLGVAETLVFLTYQTFLQAFFMSLLFFVAGYFTPGSFDAKGAAGYAKGRFSRLGWPTLLYVAVIGPVTEYYIAHSWRTTHTFAHEMGLYVTRLRFLSGTGPMWFCAALLIFSLAYAAWRTATPRAAPAARGGVSVRGVLMTVAAIGVATFAVRLAPGSWRSQLNMNFGDFPAYVVMFCLGIWARRSGALDAMTDRFAARLGGSLVAVAAAAWPVLLVTGGAFRGEAAAFSGGLHWQSAAKALWEAAVCVGMSLGVLALARRRLGGQGRFARHMSDNAFAVYVIHPPILIAIALAMSALAAPALPKFLLLWAASFVACFGVAAPLARRIPGLAAVLS